MRLDHLLSKEEEVGSCLTVQSSMTVYISGGDAPAGHTRSIPNTMVKTQTAENTTLATAWEDRWLPDLIKKHHLPKGRCFIYTFNVYIIVP